MKMHKTLTLLACASLFFLSACERDEELFDLNSRNGVPLSNVIKFSNISSGSVLADSMSFTLIKVQVSQNADSLYRSVVLTTTLGTFPNNTNTITLPINALGEASVQLISDKPGTAQIRATVKNVPIDTTVVFIPALPDDMTLTADDYTLDTTQSINVTARLFRNIGLPSDNLKVLFKATGDNPTNFLVVPPFAFSNNGTASVTISNPFHYKDWFTIEAKTASAKGDTLVKTIRVRIQ